MEKLTIRRLRELTSREAFEQGKTIYNRGKVRSYKDHGKKLQAQVMERGSFDVTVVLGETGLRGFCSCALGAYCSHLVAVLLKYIYETNGAAGESGSLEEVDQLFAASNFGGIKRIKPGKRFRNQVITKEIEEIFNSGEPLISPKKRYAPGFALFQSGGKFRLKAVALFIKKDGAYGRFLPYDKNIITEEAAPFVAYILSLVLQGAGAFVPLLERIALMGVKDFPLYDEESKKPVLLLSVDRLSLPFKIAGFYEEKIPVFRPCLTFESGKKGNIKVSPSMEAIEIENGSAGYYQCRKGRFFYTTREDVVRLIRFLNKHKEGYCLPDIEKLKNSLPSKLLKITRFQVTAGKIEIRSENPGLILALEEGESFLEISLVFSYNGYDTDIREIDDYVLGPVSEAEDTMVVYKRNRELEEQCHGLLFNNFFNLLPAAIRSEAGEIFKLKGCDFISVLTFKEFLVSRGREFMDRKILLKAGDKLLNPTAASVKVQLSWDMDWLNIKVVNQEGQGLFYDPGMNGFVKAGDAWQIVEPEDLEILEYLHGEGLDETGELETSSRNLSLIERIAALADNRENPNLMRARKAAAGLKGADSIPETPLPKEFRGALRSYQIEGYRWLRFLHDCHMGGCLADDMGLGKTVQTLALLQSLKEERRLGASLLVVPVVTLSNWEREIEQFAPGLSYVRHTGSKRKKDREFLTFHDLIITSYHTLRMDIGFFRSLGFYYIILDEAHYIKNADSLIFKSIRSLKSAHRLSLTGTPVENRTLELWSQFDFLSPGLLGNRKSFNARYVVPIEKEQNAEAAEELKNRVFPFILRRKKSEVLTELPEKEDILYYCGMEEAQAAFYDRIKEEYREAVFSAIREKGIKSASMEILGALLRLRQGALFPGLLGSEYEAIESCKLESLKSIIEEIVMEGHKVLIFSQFVKALERVSQWLRTRELKFSMITGATKDRAGEIDRFRKCEDVPLFLLSLKAGGVGINLTEADYVILFDPWWNPAAESQAVDRAHRMGRTEKVTVYRMIVKDSIEEKILKLQEKKRDLVSRLISEENGPAKSLSEEDLEKLFE